MCIIDRDRCSADDESFKAVSARECFAKIRMMNLVSDAADLKTSLVQTNVLCYAVLNDKSFHAPRCIFNSYLKRTRNPVEDGLKGMAPSSST